MRRIVEVTESAIEAIAQQCTDRPGLAEEFTTSDLLRELRYLADHFDSLPEAGPGRRLTQHEPNTVALFHVFASIRDDGVVVVTHVDIWLDEPPSPPE